MSDSKRATLITVGAPKSANNNVTKTVRLTINLDESNESKYPELNYKELVRTQERKKKLENGKTTGLDPFSDNDDDAERVARKFEQKYGGKSTYGRKGRTKRDDFVDIGAGYDENDSFIDNTDGYDEMIPPETDTLYGGFYINSGSLEFKTVENQPALSDAEQPTNRRNKRRISSSSSDNSSSSSSGERPAHNGHANDEHIEHRKKKNKNTDKKAKKVRRTDSTAASGKQTSDDAGAEADSVDSRTSHSDSLASTKPAPGSEPGATSDSSRDVEAKSEPALPAAVGAVLDALQAAAGLAHAGSGFHPTVEELLMRMSTSLRGAGAAWRRAAWTRAAGLLRVSRSKLLRHVAGRKTAPATVNNVQQPTTTVTTTTTAATTNNKRKADDDLPVEDYSSLTDEQREAKIVEVLQRLKQLIDERKPAMMASYNAECERVQEERRRLQQSTGTAVDKRLPKRRFPWCGRARSLLAALVALAAPGADGLGGAALLAARALPLFPPGFVRMPTLLRQADLNKECKASDLKRSRSTTQPPAPAPAAPAAPGAPAAPALPEPIHFPSSLTVTTTTVKLDKEDDKPHNNHTSVFGTILNTYTLNKDRLQDKQDDKDDKIEDYTMPNNLGSITITPVVNQKEKKVNNAMDKHKEPLIRVKSPAALNDMVKNNQKEQKQKKIEKTQNHTNAKEKPVDSPLHVDTSFQPNKKDPSPKGKDEISLKKIENMRIAENNIPRPTLVPVTHSPTFAKPDKRPPEIKKKKDVVIVSDLDPLGDVATDPVSVDDSSSDVEVIEDNKSDKSEQISDPVPCKDNVRVSAPSGRQDRVEEEVATKEDFESIMRNLKEMEHSQEPKINNSFGGVIKSAKLDKSSAAAFARPPLDKNKLTNFFEQNGWM